MAVRLRALDGLRGLLALYILAGHTAPFLRMPALFGMLGPLLSHGRGAVEFFFVLSGMVILRSLSLGAAPALSAGAFLAARAGRLLPVYLIALTLAAATLGLGDPFSAMPWLAEGSAAHDVVEAAWPQPWLGHLAAHVTMTQGVLPQALLPDAEFSVLGPAWSLSTEWQFYLIIAAILAVRAKRPASGDAWHPYWNCVMLLGLIGLAVGLLPAEWQPGRAFLPHEIWYFALGVASHGLLGAGWRGAGLPGAWRWWVSVAAAICLAWQQNILIAMVVPLLWAACLFCVTPIVPLPCRPLAAVLNSRPLQWFGAISYPLYLIHTPVQRLLMLAIAPLAQGQWRMFSLLWGPPAILLPVTLAYALHRWVELPCWQWSRHRALGLGATARVASPGLIDVRRGRL